MLSDKIELPSSHDHEQGHLPTKASLGHNDDRDEQCEATIALARFPSATKEKSLGVRLNEDQMQSFMTGLHIHQITEPIIGSFDLIMSSKK